MRRRIISGLLAFSLMFGGVPSIASEILSTDSKGTSETTLSQEATQFSVAIPVNLPIDVDRDGEVSTASNVEIVNNSYGPVEVKGIKVSTNLGGIIRVWKGLQKRESKYKRVWYANQ